MAWNIAGVGRRTRDAAAEAARRAGMRLDDWLDEAIADYVGLAQEGGPTTKRRMTGSMPPPNAWKGSLDETNERPVPPAPGAAKPLDSVIGRLEMRLARAEAHAARAFETVAQILERDDAARDSDRRALIDAVRRLESIRANLTGAAQGGEAGSSGLPQPPGFNPKAPFDLKAAVSQIAMRRHELESGADPSPPTALPEGERRASSATG